MTTEQIQLYFAIVGFVAAAAAIVRYSTLKTAITSLEAVVSAQKEELAVTKSRNIEQGSVIVEQGKQIEVLQNTVNSSELIRALDAHLANHHKEAMAGQDRLHVDLVGLKSVITALRRQNGGAA